MKHFNILNEGSKSPGATNVKRVVGTKYGYLVFFLDFCKGMCPLLLLKFWLNDYEYLRNTLSSFTLIGSIVGHNHSCFLKFRGGKGVATTIGGLSVLMPGVTFLGLILWYSVFSITRFVSLASLCFAMTLPLNAYLFAYPKEIIYLTVFLMIAIFVRHLPNIQRLWNGVENRFTRKKK